MEFARIPAVLGTLASSTTVHCSIGRFLSAACLKKALGNQGLFLFGRKGWSQGCSCCSATPGGCRFFRRCSPMTIAASVSILAKHEYYGMVDSLETRATLLPPFRLRISLKRLMRPAFGFLHPVSSRRFCCISPNPLDFGCFALR